MKITIPEFCLVALVGTSGSGKSTFARKHFLPTEVVSSDACRGIVSDDENDLDATEDAFRLVHFIAETRLRRRKIVVVDATNVRKEDRARLVRIAKDHHALAVAIVINPGEDVCHERNKERPDRQFGPHVVRNQTRNLKRDVKRIDKEGFRYVHEFRSVEDIEAVEIERTRVWSDKRHEEGPFDIIGDVHGCRDELLALVAKLGYDVRLEGEGEERRVISKTPEGRRLVFVGDLADRGPGSPDVFRIVMHMVAEGQALCVPGNHDVKLLRYLNGRNVKLNHGLDLTIQQLDREPPAFKRQVKDFIDALVSHAWLDGGRLAVAHAGIKENMLGRASGAIREFCLYGETSGETDEFGLPIRYNWAAEYRGATTIVYGHTPVPEAQWLNNTLCVDTGCVFGGSLTALRWPEKEIVSVPAGEMYAKPIRPLAHPPTRPGVELTMQAIHDDLLDLDDVIGKRIVTTAAGRTVQVPEANAAAALEVMARFAINPKWLIHLPPTMSPCETSAREGFLEHPDEAFAYFQKEGVEKVIVEEKHMGSRVLAVVCRDTDTAARRFGVTSGEAGALFTRTGRAFFNDPMMASKMLGRIRTAMDGADFWERFKSDWALIDAELMPWSAKAQSLLREQYASTGAAAQAGLGEAVELLEKASQSGLDTQALQADFASRKERADKYVEAYRRYCWPVETMDDYRFAPFHLLATEAGVHMDKDHLWHLHELDLIAEAGDETLMTTKHQVVDLASDAEKLQATQWWLEQTGNGGEGMVVKPLEFIRKAARGLVQPAIKVRGSEYLRIIYGPEYDLEENLTRLKRRGLGLKRSLALREFALGEEALKRFVACEPLRRVHECVFAILAMECEPVDPRL